MEKEKKGKEPEPKAKPKEKEEAKPAAKKKAKRRFKSTSIDHHDNGSHTVRHVPITSGDVKEPGMKDDVSYAVPDDEALHSALRENLGEGGEPPAGAGPSASPEPEQALKRLSTGQ